MCHYLRRQCVSIYPENLRNEEDARDVVQTAFEKMWIHRDEVDASKVNLISLPLPTGKMIDHIRKVKRIQLKEEFNENAKVQNRPANNLKKILDEALARLSETQRTLVLLKDYEGYSYEEIGQR